VSYRQRPAKPTAALWMLVAAADVMLVLASVGTAMLVALASVGAVTVAGIGTWRHLQRAAGPAAFAARRRRL
jgi:hypothetical protein